MEFIIGLFRFILFVDCALLILLVLIQLPKKEAGLGVAFGGAATDALFGAGAGNAITKITKWCAVFFFCLSLGLAVADSHYARVNREAVSKEMAAVMTEGAEKAAAVEATAPETAAKEIAPAVETNAPAPAEAAQPAEAPAAPATPAE